MVKSNALIKCEGRFMSLKLLDSHEDRVIKRAAVFYFCSYRSSMLLSLCISCQASTAVVSRLGAVTLSSAGIPAVLQRGHFATAAPASSSSSSSGAAGHLPEQQPQYPPLYAACVLERLPVRHVYYPGALTLLVSTSVLVE